MLLNRTREDFNPKWLVPLMTMLAFEPLHACRVCSDAMFLNQVNAQEWTRAEGIEMFYFSAFDEAWKVGAEGSVGAFWGLWDEDEVRKF